MGRSGPTGSRPVPCCQFGYARTFLSKNNTWRRVRVSNSRACYRGLGLASQPLTTRATLRVSQNKLTTPFCGAARHRAGGSGAWRSRRDPAPERSTVRGKLELYPAPRGCNSRLNRPLLHQLSYSATSFCFSNHHNNSACRRSQAPCRRLWCLVPRRRIELRSRDCPPEADPPLAEKSRILTTRRPGRQPGGRGGTTRSAWRG